LRATRLSLLLCLLGLGLCTPGAAAAEREPFFPKAGSNQYDVRSYAVDLSFRPQEGGRIEAKTSIVAVAERQIGGYFSLDYKGPPVIWVAVDGHPVKFRRDGGKLGVFADRTIPKGERFGVKVRYGGVPPTIADPDNSEEGWFPTDDGAIAVGEPQGTAAWIPCNNVPWDKASFEFAIDVPIGLRAVANGRQGRVQRSGGRARYTWTEPAPMSTYLALLDIGRGQMVKGRIGKIPSWTLIDPRLSEASRPLAALPEIIRFQSRLYGGYPFGSAGSVVDYAPRFAYALETQSRPIYAFVPDLTTVVHETAHQWFGDSVGLERWPQIWLNEGFATWSEWYYAERHGGRSAHAIFARLYRVPASNTKFWNPPTAHPGSPKHLFGPSVYVRGGMALQALREKIGTKTMLRLLRRWTTSHRHASANIGEFKALAEQLSGRDLEPLFQRWLYQRGKPVAPGAKAGVARVERPAGIDVQRPGIGTSDNGLASILAPVRYPIEMAGRVAKTRISLVEGRHERVIRTWLLHERLSAGAVRRPDRRRSFAFVHKVGLDADLSRRLRQSAWVQVIAGASLDVDEDGRPERRWAIASTARPPARAHGKPLCSSLPHLRLKRGGRVSLPLPVCDRKLNWRAIGNSSRGSARVRGGRLIYTAPQRFRGTDEIELAAAGLRLHTRATVGAPGGLVVRALGDSVTAGFGYYSSGRQMGFEELLDCRPAAREFNDACSSNSLNEESAEGTVSYSPDYGLANKISWAAQWADEYGVTNFKNFAISGSEPANWAPKGEFHFLTEKIESEDPDYILLTLGANPLLSNVLFGLRNMECAVESELPEFEACVRAEFDKVGLRQNLRSVYSDLVAHTQATIFLMQYHLSVPWSALAYSATEIAAMGKLLNLEIASTAAEVGSSRLRVVAPPHFNVGVDVSPVYPSRSTCRLYPVDGPRVQSEGAQDELESHVLSFCSGPAGGGEPWVINGDTGIHPSAAGYEQMASQVPAPD
jgi:hypothetical protein